MLTWPVVIELLFWVIVYFIVAVVIGKIYLKSQ